MGCAGRQQLFLPKLVHDPALPSIQFSGVFLQGSYPILQRLNFAFTVYTAILSRKNNPLTVTLVGELQLRLVTSELRLIVTEKRLVDELEC